MALKRGAVCGRGLRTWKPAKFNATTAHFLKATDYSGRLAAMSKRSNKRRRKAVISPPNLEEIAPLSPPESNKKPRLLTDDTLKDDGAICSGAGTSSFATPSAAASTFVVSGKSPSQWSVEEVVDFMRKSGLQESVLEAFRGEKKKEN